MKQKIRQILIKIMASIVPLGMLLSFSQANAITTATISLKPSEETVSAGQQFTLSVIVNPNEATGYTVKTHISFPPDMLSVQKWQFGSPWYTLRQPEYDVLDNNKGYIIRTAGFAKGFTTPQLFGTITFLAKKTGTATINISSGSSVLNQDNDEIFGSGGSAVIKIGQGQSQEPYVPVITPAPSIQYDYSANMLNETIKSDESAVVIVKLNNQTKDNIPVNVTLKDTVYDTIGQVVKSQENPVQIVTHADFVDKIDTKGLIPGTYSIVNEVTYEGQMIPQQTTLTFTIAQPVITHAPISTTVYWVIGILLVLFIILLLIIIMI